MKNRYIRSAIALLLSSIMLAGCTNSGSSNSDLKPATESDGSADNSTAESSSLDAEAEEEDVNYTPTHFLGTSEGNYSYVIDINGNCIQTIDNYAIHNDLEAKFENADLSMVRLACGDLVFCSGHKHDDWNSYVFYVENQKTKEADIFLELEDNYYTALDYYKGKIYLYYFDQEYIYTFHDDLSYEVKESGLADFFEAANDYDVKYKNDDKCPSRQLDENGYIPAFDEERWHSNKA